MNEERINAFFGDDQNTGLGTGWWSGILAVFFGVLAFGGVLTLHFPQYLSTPEMRIYYPMNIIRMGIEAAIWAAMVFRRALCDLAQKEGDGFHRNASGRCGRRTGRIKCADQCAAHQWAGHRP